MNNSFTSQITLKIEEEQRLLEQHQLKIQDSLQQGLAHCEKLNNVFKVYELNASNTINEHIESLNQYQSHLTVINQAHTDLSQQLAQISMYKTTIEDQEEVQRNQITQLMQQIQEHQNTGIEIFDTLTRVENALSRLSYSGDQDKKDILNQLNLKPDFNTIQEHQQSIADQQIFFMKLLMAIMIINMLLIIYNTIRGI